MYDTENHSKCYMSLRRCKPADKYLALINRSVRSLKSGMFCENLQLLAGWHLISQITL